MPETASLIPIWHLSPSMDLLGAAWMVRDHGESISALHLSDDGSLLVGGWEGMLKSWSPDGDLIWAVDCGERISSIIIDNNRIFLTAGLKITCVEKGSIIWSHALEGSADQVIIHEEKVIATSSVYDIEHGDFMESAIWRFAVDGELLSVERMDEKPWTIASFNGLRAGLGRPKCGMLVDQKVTALSSDSPVTCGVNNSKVFLFGHADGAVSKHDGSRFSKADHAIVSLSINQNIVSIADEQGGLEVITTDGEKLWQSQGGELTGQVIGFSQTHWCGRNTGEVDSLEVCCENGELLASAEVSRVMALVQLGDRVAAGFEDGSLAIWQKSLFDRRKEADLSVNDSHRSDLAAKLRSLRG